MTALPLRATDQRRLDDFRAFYALLASVRDEIRAAVAAGDTPPSAELVRRRLRDRLQELDSLPAADGAVAPGGIDPPYVMVAMADAVMAHETGDWAGRPAWIARPLEMELYGTRDSGDRLFAAGEVLAAGPRDETGAAALILAALLLGFRGPYRQPDGSDAPEVARLRDRLYVHLHGAPWSPDDVAPLEGLGEPRTGESVRRLPALWPWLAALAAVIVVYTPVSHALWRWHARHIQQLADAVLQSDPTAAPGPASDR